MNKKLSVIGGGLGGMAAALRARAKGYEVNIYCQCPMLGGRAQVYSKDGYTFDAGPTVITAPFLLEELFALFDRQLRDYVTLVPIEPWYRFLYPDGMIFNYGGSLEELLSEIGRISPEDKDNYLELLAHSKEIYEIGFEQLADHPFHQFTQMAKVIPSLIRLKSYKSVWQLVTQFIKHPALRQAFSIQPLLVGGNPVETTSIYSLIHYLERKWGVHYVMGGTGQLIEAMTILMKEVGIKIHLNSAVEHIKIVDKQVQSIVLQTGEHVSCDVVISNVDPLYLYRYMIAAKHQPLVSKWKTALSKPSMGLFVWYFGTKKKYNEVPHHTIIMGDDYKRLLADIFNKKVLSNEMAMYLHRPTATDPSMAPKGHDAFYCLCPVPNLSSGIDWQKQAGPFIRRMITKLEQTCLPGLSDELTISISKTPIDFKTDYNAFQGSGFSVAPLFYQSAWFRHHNQAEGINGLYLVGAGTHPGAGIPGVLSSAKIVEKLLPQVAI
ncbi:phytoene desaturase family protein [Legionella hackeliae]|uniref:Phytoene dehydrogenase n=1 Tax=Legionella hackeliae TaxID=449 RepID=A0A0A8USZ2_LEGHA|nr:phytoene desaturase family protein [Legionella hackeliae]KTD08758.1 Phytoene desaturase (lycopene-forming) [Legionella hackeliae]CEK10187.1 Phytoene dehydrogenase [Legionella hackeliae]STX46911.1 Dehydrosqualene desaturase [Legionella hackeliae]